MAARNHNTIPHPQPATPQSLTDIDSMNTIMRRLIFLMMICPMCHGSELPAVKVVDLEALKLDLPKPLQLRAEMARLTHPEFVR